VCYAQTKAERKNIKQTFIKYSIKYSIIHKENIKIKIIKMTLKKRIESVDFSLASPDLIRKLSVVEIKTIETYDDDGYPMENGLMDPRLGVIDPGIKCKTCGGRLKECLGHMGHIELVRPVVHVGYAKQLLKILRMTCRRCGKVKIDDAKRAEYESIFKKQGFFSFKNLAEIEDLSSAVNICPHCGESQTKIKFIKPYSYYEEKDNKEEDRILITDIEEWLMKIPDEDLKFIDIKARPEWIIIRALPVMPICARPSITLESADRSEDDLTHKLVDILRINQRIKASIDSGAPQLIIEDLWELLQYHVATYFDNELSGMPPARQRSGRPLKTISQRLKGKEGRFRNNLSGKRVNFSARTVISPDPSIDIDEVGIPEIIAKEMTVPECVNEGNIERLRDAVLNGSEVYPGANYVIVDGKRKRILKSNKETLSANLKIGDVVERHLINGDTVLFNRQPSLHRNSMMAHHARILPFKTFRLNTAVCAPYNADFDGDEMNLHVPQSAEAVAEGEILMNVKHHIISPRYGGPIIGGRHDHVTGMFILTTKKEISREDALQITAGIVRLPDGKEKFTGTEIFSLLLPNDFNFSYDSKLGGKVVIKNGMVVSGVIDSKGMAGVLLNQLLNVYGEDVAADFINKSTRIAINAITMYGFTTGIDATSLKAEGAVKIEKRLDDAEKRVDDLIKKKNEGKLTPLLGKSIDESLEDYIMMELGNARNDCGTIAEEYVEDASAVIMAKTGARGNVLNLTQMAGTVGQQAVRGKRIKRGYHNRTLSSFEKGDVSAASNGFIRSSFKKGLNPREYFFHAMGGRETLVDTAIRTGRSGYMQRRLVNALQDLKINERRSVVDSDGNIVQFLYGEDGVDPMKKSLLEEHESYEWFS